jgi:hypothetical protein
MELHGAPADLSEFFTAAHSPANPITESGISNSQISFESVEARIGKIIRVLDPLRVSDPLEERRTRFLKAQLIAVQSRISSWSRERDIVTVEQLESMLHQVPDITRDTMMSICLRLKQWMEWPERSSAVLAPNNSTSNKMIYLETMLEGYDTLETLRAVCDGLYNLVSFLSSQNSSDRLDNGADGVPGQRDFRSHMARSTTHTNLARDTAAVAVQDSSPTPIDVVSPEKPRIQLLYSTLLQALRAVIVQLENKVLPNTIYSRIVVWGCGLFQDSISLDLILQQDELTSTMEFRSHIVGVLADIAVILGKTRMLDSYMELTGRQLFS